jgi:Fur family ferric uptake transcriptional regulator
MGVGERELAKQRFLGFLGQRRMRSTAQRRAIVETVFNTNRHFTAEQLLGWSRQADRSVSRATVYRTLTLLTESGLVREMDLGKDRRFYDPNYANQPNHSHIRCQDCDQLIEFESEDVTALVAEIGRRLGFTVVSHRLEITGICEELRRTGRCAH